MTDERHIGGLSCHEVLALLSELVDGSLDEATTAKVAAHVEDCDRCASFGGAFAALVRALGERLADEPLAPALVARLEDRLASEP